MRLRHLTCASSLLAVLVLTAGWVHTTGLFRLTLHPESKLWVEGTSSVHDWSCEAEAVSGLIEAGEAGNDAAAVAHAITGVTVTVPAATLDCKKGTMNKKAREALKAGDHPEIRYRLLESTVLPGSDDGWVTLQTQGRLQIAGVEKSLAMTAKGQRLPDGRFRFTGSTPLSMTDFGIDPPTAMFGALKTGERVVVHFDVVAQAR